MSHSSEFLVLRSLQAQKFAGVEDEIAQECVHNIRKAKSPEEAARMGRTLARKRPDLVRTRLEVPYNLQTYNAILDIIRNGFKTIIKLSL